VTIFEMIGQARARKREAEAELLLASVWPPEPPPGEEPMVVEIVETDLAGEVIGERRIELHGVDEADLKTFLGMEANDQ
jgi:hypothetical protein